MICDFVSSALAAPLSSPVGSNFPFLDDKPGELMKVGLLSGRIPKQDGKRKPAMLEKRGLGFVDGFLRTTSLSR